MGQSDPPPIDRGWAWVITAVKKHSPEVSEEDLESDGHKGGRGLCLMSFINGGFIKSYGIFFSAFLETFGGSATETQFIRSTRSILATVFGPFGTALSERFTERAVVMVGAGFMSLALILSSFAPNLQVLIFTYGIFSGIGISLVVGPSKVCLGRYFEKKRGRANSLSLVGTSVGQIVIPPFVSLLMDRYALRGTLLIYGGIYLNIIITGALLRPIESYKSQSESAKISQEDGSEDAITKEVVVEDDVLLSDTADGVDTLHSNGNPKSIANGDPEVYVQDGSDVDNNHTNDAPNVYVKQRDKLTLSTAEEPLSTDHFRGSTKSLSEIMRSIGSRINVDTMEECEPLQAELESSSEKSKRKCVTCSPFISFFKYIFDKEVLTNPLFVLYLITNSLFVISNMNQTTFIVPRAEEYGISRKMAAVLLSIIGGCDIFGGLLLGVLADVKRLKSHQVMAIGSLLTSICMLTLPLSTNFAGMAANVAVYGIFGSSHAILGLPVVVDFVGKNLLAKAIGLTIFFQGMAAAVFAPILGLVKDRSGSYDNVFYVTGSMQVLGCALLLFLEPLARRHQNATHPPVSEELDIKT